MTHNHHSKLAYVFLLSVSVLILHFIEGKKKEKKKKKEEAKQFKPKKKKRVKYFLFFFLNFFPLVRMSLVCFDSAKTITHKPRSKLTYVFLVK